MYYYGQTTSFDPILAPLHSPRPLDITSKEVLSTYQFILAGFIPLSRNITKSVKFYTFFKVFLFSPILKIGCEIL